MRNFGEIAREKAFWTFDFLKGSKVKNHYAAIKGLLEDTTEASTTEKAKGFQLKKLLDHAVATTPFYKSKKEYSKLEDFPVINKSMIRESFGDFISNAFNPAELIPVVTSGSTGTPFKVLHNENKRIRNTADTMYFAKLAGFNIGDRLIYLKIWSDLNRKSGLHQWMQNIEPIDVISFSDEQIKALIESMKKRKNTFGFLGYSSAIELIGKYLDRTKSETVKTNLASAISMSEALNEYTKESIKKYFGTSVYSRYSNIENGIIAQQVPGQGNRFLVNTASYKAEILSMTSNEPVKNGELGRLVVTDLFNLGMPLIRYDTGDVAALSDSSDKFQNTYLETIEGRKLDLIYATDGSLLSSYIVYKNMWQYTEIDQYQLIQHGPKNYLFKININKPFIRKEQLEQEFKKYLGADADFKIEFVDEIPLLASGKRKKIVNTFYNQQ